MKRSAIFIRIPAAMLIAGMISTAMVTSQAEAEPDHLMIFAAASTTNAVTEINRLFENHGRGVVAASFAASSTLAKQIDNGAPADVYLSANIKWMDYLEQRKMIVSTTRRELLGNRIVLIVPAGSPVSEVPIMKNFNLADLLGDGRLALGDPAHVPAGIYGKAALISLGAWSGVVDKLAPAKDVRTALVLVERGEAPMGLVYATDAALTPKIRVVGLFPQSSHPAIIYPVAAVKGHDTAATRAYLEFLSSAEAAAVFEQFGFTLR